MIIAHVIGGLGNQMFQYAAARAMAQSCGQSLALDISGFDGFAPHQGFELFNKFEGPSQSALIASPADIREVLGWAAVNPALRLLKLHQLAWLRPQSLVLEPHFGYWPGFRQRCASSPHLTPHAFLCGYWQSEKYFCDIEAVIRQEFRFKPAVNIENAGFIDKINAVNAVSLHVRRGDYVQNPATLSVHGVCSVAYYQSAIQYIEQRVPNPHFFVFSDDMQWTAENLRIKAPHELVVHNRGADSFNDMRLMSQCRHHVVANSSFSWWGAWLNACPDKIVVAPENWFARPKNTQDLIPANWVRL